MAYERLNEYTDELVRSYERSKERAERPGVSVGERAVATARMDEALGNMAQYYLLVLKPGAKFKSQAHYCLSAIGKISPGYAEGLSERRTGSKVKRAKP